METQEFKLPTATTPRTPRMGEGASAQCWPCTATGKDPAVQAQFRTARWDHCLTQLRDSDQPPQSFKDCGHTYNFSIKHGPHCNNGIQTTLPQTHSPCSTWSFKILIYKFISMTVLQIIQIRYQPFVYISVWVKMWTMRLLKNLEGHSDSRGGQTNHRWYTVLHAYLYLPQGSIGQPVSWYYYP
jgi:hypothetical protein